MIVARVISAVIGYVCGLFLLGYFIGKKENVDLHNVGSGNVGTTNTARSLGAKAGVATLIGDICKVFVAMFLAWLIFHKNYEPQIHLLELYAALGAVIGHNFPIYMKGKGGKGIACTGGMLLGFCPIAVPVSLGIFLLVSAITRYVSLGSIIGLLSMLAQVIAFGETGHLPVPDEYLPEVYLIIAFITGLGIVRHRANIVRLVNGTENKFSLHKKEQ